jgi:hypothetical protein
VRARAAALALFGLLLAVSLAWSAGRSVRRIYWAFAYAGETPIQERSRSFDPLYTQAIEDIRRTIPPHATYALVDADPDELGSVLWVRFDLAPRRPVYLGFLRDLSKPAVVRRRLVRDVRWVIVASVDRPPVLYERPQFLQALREGSLR